MQDVTLTWKGIDYRIEARDVLPVIALIEERVTLAEIVDAAQRGTAPLAKIAMAYGAALRHAGARVNDDEVYSGMFLPDNRSAAAAAVNALLSLMVPPEHLQAAADDGTKKKEKAEAGDANSLKKPTKRRSRGASRPASSGG